MIPKERWEWFGHAGHLIVGRDCRFHLCTVVGPWWISTVGEYFPDAPVREILAKSRKVRLEGMGDDRVADYIRKIGYDDIGAGRKYETMVFRAGPPCRANDCNCGAPIPTRWTELDADGYNNAADARQGHLKMCEKWATKKEADDEPE